MIFFNLKLVLIDAITSFFDVFRAKFPGLKVRGEGGAKKKKRVPGNQEVFLSGRNRAFGSI